MSNESQKELERLNVRLGDLVRLKSGGPDMTAEFVSPDLIGTVWFEGATLHRAEFVLDALERPENKGTNVADLHC